MLFYQDFKDTFVCNTQPCAVVALCACGCFIRISKILLYAIHNNNVFRNVRATLFYQDFKDTFVCNTQPTPIIAILNVVVLSGFQRYFCMQYTTTISERIA